MEIATFGAGCFWGVQAAFETIQGVLSTTVGYMGGTRKNPTYEDVCTNTTGHVEVVQICFDQAKVSYEELLDVFWKIHDPTQHNRQGPDIGTQYRSIIFYHNKEQKQIAEASKKKQQLGIYKDPIVTEITEATEFWKVEEYHQHYLEKHKISTPKTF